MAGFAGEQSYARDRRIPESEITGTDPTLTYADVEKAFSATRPAPESPSDQR